MYSNSSLMLQSYQRVSLLHYTIFTLLYYRVSTTIFTRLLYYSVSTTIFTLLLYYRVSTTIFTLLHYRVSTTIFTLLYYSVSTTIFTLLLYYIVSTTIFTLLLYYRVITFLSPMFLESDDRMDEYNAAWCLNRQTNCQTRLAPMLCSSVPSLPTYMSLIQWVDIRYVTIVSVSSYIGG